MAQATSSAKKAGSILYQPRFQKAGRHAVYVSYTTLQNSVDDAEYSVYHKGQRTVFHVNQRMGGNTWVYLGTFDFDEGCSTANCVVLTNYSRSGGYVTADAVKIGGGMGNVTRGGSSSGLPRTLEGTRYFAQWAGAPDSVYSPFNGKDDYVVYEGPSEPVTRQPGEFAIFLPPGAHAPCGRPANGPEKIRKVVVKVLADGTCG